MATNGNLYMLKMNGQVVAALKSNDVETGCDTLEVASPTQGEWRERIPGRKTWKMTASWLMLSATTMATLLQAGQVFSMEVYDRQRTRNTVYGQARLEQCRIDATIGNLVRGSFQFKGTAWLRPTYPAGDFNRDFNNDFLIN